MEYCNGMMYAVKQGDTLYSISLKYGIPLVLLLRANPYVDVYNLQVGETICIPMKDKECHTYCKKNTGEEWEVERTDRDDDDRDDRDDRDYDRDDRNDRGDGRGNRNDRDYDHDDRNDRGDGRDNRNDRDYDRDDRNRRIDYRDDMYGRNDEDGDHDRMMLPGASDGGRNREPGNIRAWENRTEPISEPENTLEGEEAVDVAWQRYVSKPGDTLESMLEVRCPQALEEFLEENPMDRIYLLPGIAYRCKTGSKK